MGIPIVRNSMITDTYANPSGMCLTSSQNTFGHPNNSMLTARSHPTRPLSA